MSSTHDQNEHRKNGWADKIGELLFAHHSSRPDVSAPLIHSAWNPAIDGMAQILLSGFEGSQHFPPNGETSLDIRKLARLLTMLKKEGVERLLISDPGGLCGDAQAFELARRLGFAPSWLRVCGDGNAPVAALKLLESGLVERLIITLEGTEAVDFIIRPELCDRVAIQFFATDVNWREQAEELALRHNAALFLLSYPYLARPGIDAPEPETLLLRALELEESLPDNIEIALFEMPFCAVSGGEPPWLTTLRIPPFVDFGNIYTTDDGSLLRRNFEWPGRRRSQCRCTYSGNCPGLAAESDEAEPRRGIFPFLQRIEWADTGTQGFLRPALHCNQKCRFCWVEHGYRMPPLHYIQRELARMDIRRLIISGGEPTLYPHLVELVAYAGQRGMDVELQSNAVRMAETEYTARLVEAGLKRAFVSFHSHKKETYDYITGMPDGYERALSGLHRLFESGLEISLSHVINRLNYKDLPEYVRFISREFDAHKQRLTIVFSVVMDSSGIPDPGVLLRFSELKPYLTEALDFCLSNGLRFDGMHTPCGVPYCILSGDMRYYPTIDHAYHSGAHVYVEACTECRLKANCFGPRFMYVERFGADEFRTLK